MLNGLNVLIMGGDARYLEVIKRLSNAGANLYLIGFDLLSFNENNISHTTADKIDCNIIDAITLPVAGTKDNGAIEAVYAAKEIFFTTEMIKKTPEHCTIYTGTSNPFLENITQSCDRQLIALFTRDDLAVYNSIPTAEGTLQLVMEQTDITVHGSNVMVIGFGRVGKTVARLFSSVGANVRVVVRKSADIARITEMGLTPVTFDDLKREITSMNTVINTIPQPVIDANIIATMKTSTLIVDIASAPGGTDFVYAEKKGVKALHALGLPGKTAPRSAGRMIGSVLLELLNK